MQKEKSIKNWRDMFEQLTDPVKREEARRKTEIKERISNKKKDTGII